MNRLERCFRELKEKSDQALISFVMAGDPNIETTYEAMQALVRGGTSIIELGIPFSDPLADGPVIQAAGLRGMNSETTLKGVLECVRKFRQDYDVPVVLLGYMNTFFNFGFQKLDETLRYYGVDGLIIPDLPSVERKRFEKYFVDVYLIPLIAPNSQELIVEGADRWKGFVYCVSSYGVTGMRESFDDEILHTLNRLREITPLPLCVGFGLKDEESFKFFSNHTDGYIVGSAYVNAMADKENSVMVAEDIEYLSKTFKTYM